MTIITYNDLVAIRQQHPHKKIVCCTGVFDIVHAGHLLFFQDCKKHGDLLIVSVARDSLIKGYKDDKRPFMNEHIRMHMIDALKCVDYTILDSNTTWSDHTHNDTLEPFFSALKPDIYALNDEAVDIPLRVRICEKYGVKLIVLQRTCPKEFDAISTTKLINKILQSYPPHT